MPRPTRPGLAGASLTVVILTLNEAKRLARCVAAIPTCYPVVVVDSGSLDGTRELASSLGCIVVENAWPGFAGQRNFALEACGISAQWVLFVDADEIYSPDFYAWFEADAKGSDEFDVAEVASLLVFQEFTLRHAPGYPVYHPRLIRRNHARFVPNHAGHGETVNAESRLRYVDLPYLHYWFEGDLTGWLTKHVRLAAQEAYMEVPGGVSTARARLNLLLKHACLRIPARFLYHYVIRQGFRDGKAGFAYSLMYAWFEFTKGVVRVIDRIGSGKP
jgi:glycosyltransferase involved in cell wall biosynthesis